MELSYAARSVNGVPIRLLAERWSYTNACCDDVLSTVLMSGGRYLVVLYREVSGREGFVISARVVSGINERAVVWRARGFRIWY
jgi:hypothetical protein